MAPICAGDARRDYRPAEIRASAVDLLAAIASYLVAVVLLLVFGPLIGIGEDATSYVLVYWTVLLFQVSGMPTAVMRLAGRFRLLAYGTAANGATVEWCSASSA